MFAFSKRAASTTKLDDYVKMDLLEKETAQNIKKIWIEYHRNQHCVHAILTPDQFNNIVPRTNEWSVLPILESPSSSKFSSEAVPFLFSHCHERSIMKPCFCNVEAMFG